MLVSLLHLTLPFWIRKIAQLTLIANKAMTKEMIRSPASMMTPVAWNLLLAAS